MRMEDIQIKGNHIVWILNNTMAMDKVFIWNIKEQMLVPTKYSYEIDHGIILLLSLKPS